MTYFTRHVPGVGLVMTAKVVIGDVTHLCVARFRTPRDRRLFWRWVDEREEQLAEHHLNWCGV